MRRFTKEKPCPICGGYPTVKPGDGYKCEGYISIDGKTAHCTRPEFAGDLEAQQTNPEDENLAWVDRMIGHYLIFHRQQVSYAVWIDDEDEEVILELACFKCGIMETHGIPNKNFFKIRKSIKNIMVDFNVKHKEKVKGEK